MIEDDKNTKVVKTWLENAVELVCVVKSKPAPSILWLTEDDDGNEVHKSFDGVTEPPSGEVDSFAGYTSEHPDNYYHSHIWVLTCPSFIAYKSKIFILNFFYLYVLNLSHQPSCMYICMYLYEVFVKVC